jgi:uncharacterized membrane protein HdeD (DUF308 family)
LLAGILAIVIGVLLIVSPQPTATYLFWILGIVCLVGGVVALVSILFSRVSWGWKLLGGMIGIILGLALISQPLFAAYLAAAISLWILGAIVIVAGVVLIIMGFSRFFPWALAIAGVLVVVIGALLVLVSVIGPQKAPWVFGVAAIVAGIGVIAAALQSRKPRQLTPPL